MAIFPENEQATRYLSLLATQWHHGPGGKTGLMYSAAFQMMDEEGIVKKKHRLDLFHALRVMEMEVLDCLQRKSR